MSEKQRFGGIARLYGQLALDKFSQTHCVVIGIGGVGSWAAEALVRSGIGRITLIDMDDICTTNSNRQVHTTVDTVGQLKTVAMAARLQAINPDCQVNIVDDFISDDNLEQCIPSDADYVLECIDAIVAKAALIAYCKQRKIPIIVSGGAGGQIDPSKITCDDLSRTTMDPLLAKLRNQLRRRHNFPRDTKKKFGVKAVYSTEGLRYPWADGSVCQTRPDNSGSMAMDCASGFGACTPVTASFAFHMVAQALNKLAQP